MLTFIKFKSMTATKKQTVATPTPKHSATRTSTNGKFNSKPNGSAVASSVKLKPEPILSPEEQAEALVKQVRNYIHKKSTHVISDMALGWDMAVAIAMLKLNIPVIFAVPFEGQNQK
jgi:hypothetical protein